MKPLAGRCNAHAKAANFLTKLHMQEVLVVTNGKYHTKEINQGFSLVFAPTFGTALVIEKLGLKSSFISLLETYKLM